MILLNLPSNISVDILALWLSLSDVAAADQAICSKQIRPDWLSLVSLSELSMSDHGHHWLCDEDISSFVSWCISRNVTVDEVAFDGDLPSPHDIAIFFNKIGPKLKRFRFCGSTAHNTSLAAIGKWCTALECAELGFCSSLNGIAEFLLLASATLKKLYLHKCQVKFPSGSVIPSFPNLRVLSLVDAIDEACAIALVTACSDLRDIRLTLIHSTHALLPVIAQYHPALEVLSLCETIDLMVPELLLNVLRQLSSLTTVVFHHIDAFSDDCLQVLASECHRLVAVSLDSCEEITDIGIVALAKHCGPRLTHFDIRNCAQVTLAGVQDLVASCPCLIDLGVGFFDEIRLHTRPMDDYTLVTMLSKAPKQLQALGIECMCHDEQAMSAVVEHCPALQYLCLSDMNPTLSKQHIPYLLRSLPRLRELCVSAGKMGVTEEEVETWPRLRPGLTFSNAGWSPYWVKYVYPTFPPDDEEMEEDDEDMEEDGEDEEREEEKEEGEDEEDE